MFDISKLMTAANIKLCITLSKPEIVHDYSL